MTNSTLQSALNDRVIRVIFHKKNGELRSMDCTKNLSLIPTEDHPKNNVKEEITDKSIRVYDVIAKGWRSFIIDKVVGYNLEL